MAGLLDFLNSPEMRSGMGLLSAGMASRTPPGERMNQAMAQMDAYSQNQMRQKLMQAQMEEQQRKTALAEQQQAAKAGMFANIFGPGGGFGGVSTGGGVAESASATGAQGGLTQSRIGAMSLDQIAQLKEQYGIDLSDAWKTARQGFKKDAGSYYEGVDGSTKYMPKLGEGQGVINGQVQNAPGYAQANAQTEGMKAGAVAAAQYPYTVGIDSARQGLAAQLDVQPVYNPATQRMENVSRAQVVGATQGAPRMSPQYTGPGYAGGSAQGAAGEQLRIMQSELGKLPPNHPDRPAIEREMQRLGGAPQAQSGAYAAGPSANETAAAAAAQAKAVGTANADVVRDSDGRKKGVMYAENISNADRAIELLKLGPTASGIGALADSGAAFFGQATTGGKVAAQLDIISAGMIKNVPRFEGPQSDKDVDQYKSAAGRVADRTLPIEIRMAAAEEVRSLAQKASEQQGKSSPSGGASGGWGDKPIPTAAVNDLKMRGPKAHAQFDAVFGAGAAARALGGK